MRHKVDAAGFQCVSVHTMLLYHLAANHSLIITLYFATVPFCRTCVLLSIYMLITWCMHLNRR